MKEQNFQSAEKAVNISQVVISGVMLALQIVGLFRKVPKI